MNSNLTNKFRPTEFEDVVGHEATIQILKKEIEVREYSNCYLFNGPSGCGKTTLARVFANKINGGLGSPIEIDGASNNGVDNIRKIIESANERSLDSEYKIFIIDEAHMITTSGWNAFLKSIEEPPRYTIYIFCTTDINKLPETIPNRCQVFNLDKINNEDMLSRLELICKSMGYEYNFDGLFNIIKQSDGNLRQAISYLNLCKNYSPVINRENVNIVLGITPEEKLFDIVNSIIDKNNNILSLIDDVCRSKSVYDFIDELLRFSIELTKFCIFKNIDITSIPNVYLNEVKYATGVFETQAENIKFFKELSNKILNIKINLKNTSSPRSVLDAMFLNLII